MRTFILHLGLLLAVGSSERHGTSRGGNGAISGPITATETGGPLRRRGPLAATFPAAPAASSDLRLMSLRNGSIAVAAAAKQAAELVAVTHARTREGRDFAATLAEKVAADDDLKVKSCETKNKANEVLIESQKLEIQKRMDENTQLEAELKSLKDRFAKEVGTGEALKSRVNAAERKTAALENEVEKAKNLSGKQ